MHFLQHNRSRAGFLILALGLIGGTGCITASIVNSVEQQQAQQAYHEKQKKDFEAHQAAAAQGNLEAITTLGMEYISGLPGVPRDVGKGVVLLEQAAARQYGQAEYALGWLLLSGRNDFRWVGVTPEQLPRQPARGAELLKLSATRACSFPNLNGSGSGGRNPAYDLGQLYRGARGGLLPVDMEQADLWLARSVIHCRTPNQYGIQGASTSVMPQARIDVMAFLLMMPPNDLRTKLESGMAASELATAQQKMGRLRKAVAELEKQYPAPPQPSAKP